MQTLELVNQLQLPVLLAQDFCLISWLCELPIAI